MTPAVTMTPERRRMVEITVGKRLGQAMSHAGIKYDALAQSLGITEKRVARLVNGTSTLSAAELIWAAKVLDVPITSLCPQ